MRSGRAAPLFRPADEYGADIGARENANTVTSPSSTSHMFPVAGLSAAGAKIPDMCEVY